MSWSSEPTTSLPGAERPAGSWLAVAVAALLLALVALVIGLVTAVAAPAPSTPPAAAVGGAADIG